MEPNPRRIALEPAAWALCEATSTPPFLYQMTPADAILSFISPDTQISGPERQRPRPG